MARAAVAPGVRVRLGGGYDRDPRWLVGGYGHEGTVQSLIPGQNLELAAVVELDAPIRLEGVTGNIVVLELRYVGAKWESGAVVHVELCDFIPEPKPWRDRRQGLWVESHATIETL